MEFYFEAYHLHRHSQARGNALQIFPTIPGLIPIDNGDLPGDIVRNPDGSPVLVDNPLNPFPIFTEGGFGEFGNVLFVSTLPDSFPQLRTFFLNATAAF